MTASASSEVDNHTNAPPQSIGSSSTANSPSSRNEGYLGISNYLNFSPQPDARPPRSSPLSGSASRQIDPPPSIVESAIRSFATRCLPWMPICTIDELEEFQKPSSTGPLKYAVIAAGCKMSTASRCRAEVASNYQKAKQLLVQSSNLSVLSRIQTSLALSWAAPSPPHIVSEDSNYHWNFWAASLAFQHGLHREPRPDDPESSTRRRLWWSLLVFALRSFRYQPR